MHTRLHTPIGGSVEFLDTEVTGSHDANVAITCDLLRQSVTQQVTTFNSEGRRPSIDGYRVASYRPTSVSSPLSATLVELRWILRAVRNSPCCSPGWACPVR